MTRLLLLVVNYVKLHLTVYNNCADGSYSARVFRATKRVTVERKLELACIAGENGEREGGVKKWEENEGPSLIFLSLSSPFPFPVYTCRLVGTITSNQGRRNHTLLILACHTNDYSSACRQRIPATSNAGYNGTLEIIIHFSPRMRTLFSPRQSEMVLIYWKSSEKAGCLVSK